MKTQNIYPVFAGERVNAIYQIPCKHKFKIIRQEEGIMHGLLFKRRVVIYHLQCKKCGDIQSRNAPLVCRFCKRMERRRILIEAMEKVNKKIRKNDN